MHGSELWGCQQFGVLKKEHLFACKRFFSVGRQTTNKMIYGDLGSYPLFRTAAGRYGKFCLRITRVPVDRLSTKPYKVLYYCQDLGKKTWAYPVRPLLCGNSCGGVCLQPAAGYVNRFVSVVRQRWIDHFQQNWNASVREKERFDFYSLFRRSIQAQKHMDLLQLHCFGKADVQFRDGISQMLVHRMRYRTDVIPRDLLCPVCREETESDTHVRLSCKGYNDLRNNVTLLENSYRKTLDICLVSRWWNVRNRVVTLCVASFSKGKYCCDSASGRKTVSMNEWPSDEQTYEMNDSRV